MAEFLKSSNVRAFPTAYRKSVTTVDSAGVSSTVTYDPESKLNTEFNLTSLVSRASDMDAYVIDYSNESDVMHISMRGYWFELSGISAERASGKQLWATILIKDLDASADNTKISLPTLFSMKDGVSTLENLDDKDDGFFYGIKLSADEPVSATDRCSLQLFDETGAVPERSYHRISAAAIRNCPPPSTAAGKDEAINDYFTSGTIHAEDKLRSMSFFSAANDVQLLGDVRINTTAEPSMTQKLAVGGAVEFASDTPVEFAADAKIDSGKTLNISGTLDYSNIKSTGTDDSGYHWLWGSESGTFGTPELMTNVYVIPGLYPRLVAPVLSASSQILCHGALDMPNSDGTGTQLASKMTQDSASFYHSPNTSSTIGVFNDYDAYSTLTYKGLKTYGSSGSVELYPSKGTSSPSIKLNAYTGIVSAVSYNATSDRRLKKNITPLEPAEGLLDLPLYEYDYKETGIHSLGCIAQDLREIAPSLVEEDEKGYLSVKESKLVYYLLMEVKSLRDEVKALRESER